MQGRSAGVVGCIDVHALAKVEVHDRHRIGPTQRSGRDGNVNEGLLGSISCCGRNLQGGLEPVKVRNGFRNLGTDGMDCRIHFTGDNLKGVH